MPRAATFAARSTPPRGSATARERLYALGIGAQIAVARGDAELAGVLCGAFEELFAALGTPQAEEAERARRTCASRSRSSPTSRRSWSVGVGSAFDEAVALVRSTRASSG